MNIKFWLTSKTLWYNALTLVLVVAAHFGYQPNEVIIKNVNDILTNPAFITIVNLILRKLTNGSITFSRKVLDRPAFDSLPDGQIR
jgi:hypothetical protein